MRSPYETETTLITAKGLPVFAIIFWRIQEKPQDSYNPFLNVLTYRWIEFPVLESIEAYDTNDKQYQITKEDEELWANAIAWEISEHFKKVA